MGRKRKQASSTFLRNCNFKRPSCQRGGLRAALWVFLSLSLMKPDKAVLAHYGEKVLIHLPPIYSGSADTHGPCFPVISEGGGRLGRGWWRPGSQPCGLQLHAACCPSPAFLLHCTGSSPVTAVASPFLCPYSKGMCSCQVRLLL